MDNFTAWLDSHHIGLGAVIGSAATLIIGGLVVYFAGRLLRRLLDKEHRHHLSYETRRLIVRVIRGLLAIIVLLILLSFWGVSVVGVWTTFLGVATVIGVGFLAVWTMISNVTASLFLTVWHPFHLGVDIELVPENLGGRVVDRNMMFTVLREKQGGLLYIPNNTFFQKIFRVADVRQPTAYESFTQPAEQGDDRP